MNSPSLLDETINTLQFLLNDRNSTLDHEARLIAARQLFDLRAYRVELQVVAKWNAAPDKNGAASICDSCSLPACDFDDVSGRCSVLS